MKVMKFGGTSVGSPARMRDVARLVTGQGEVMVVVSAMSGVTNTLVELCSLAEQGRKDDATRLIDGLEKKYVDVITELFPDEDTKSAALAYLADSLSTLRQAAADWNPKLRGAVLSQGEKVSSYLLAALLNATGHPTLLADATCMVQLHDEREINLSIMEREARKVVDQARAKGAEIIVTQGFIALDADGSVTTLSRGGSDYTATLLGSALPAKCVEIWTDIDGMHSSDPRVVEHTHPVRQLSYDEAHALAYFGAKILHPLCVVPCRNANVPIHLLCTMDPSAPGTVISTKPSGKEIVATAMREATLQEGGKRAYFIDSDDYIVFDRTLYLPAGTSLTVICAAGDVTVETLHDMAHKIMRTVNVPVLSGSIVGQAAICVVDTSNAAAALRAVTPE